MTVPLLQPNTCAMGDPDLVLLLQQQFPHPLIEQSTADGIPSIWVDAGHVSALLMNVCAVTEKASPPVTLLWYINY